MNLEYNFDKIVLQVPEYRSLRKTRHRSVNKNKIRSFDALYRADLLEYDRSEDRDAFNHPLPLDTVHITDKGVRLLIWIRRQKMKAIIVPIIAAVITSIITTVIIWLLQSKLLPILQSLFS